MGLCLSSGQGEILVQTRRSNGGLRIGSYCYFELASNIGTTPSDIPCSLSAHSNSPKTFG